VASANIERHELPVHKNRMFIAASFAQSARLVN